jgi:hypothetical protein
LESGEEGSTLLKDSNSIRDGIAFMQNCEKYPERYTLGFTVQTGTISVISDDPVSLNPSHPIS